MRCHSLPAALGPHENICETLDDLGVAVAGARPDSRSSGNNRRIAELAHSHVINFHGLEYQITRTKHTGENIISSR
jgi:hypothetical protein